MYSRIWFFSSPKFLVRADFELLSTRVPNKEIFFTVIITFSTVFPCKDMIQTLWSTQSSYAHLKTHLPVDSITIYNHTQGITTVHQCSSYHRSVFCKPWSLVELTTHSFISSHLKETFVFWGGVSVSVSFESLSSTSKTSHVTVCLWLWCLWWGSTVHKYNTVFRPRHSVHKATASASCINKW